MHKKSPRMVHSMKTEWIMIVGLLVVIVGGAVFWMGSMHGITSVNNTSSPPDRENPDDHPAIPPGTTYTFDAAFEPPAGYVIHGSGGFNGGEKEYLSLLESPSVYPQSSTIFYDLTSVPNSDGRSDLDAFLTEQKKAGRTTEVFLGFETVNGSSGDAGIATTSNYDASIDALAEKFKAYGLPVYLRIGGEMNGPWAEHHAYQFPIAFQKIVDRFKAKGADNVAFVWCTEPSAGNDFDEKDASGKWKWYPGDDYVDWACIDLFFTYQFKDGEPEFENGKITQKGVTERFLSFAIDHQKPVMIAELSAGGTHITSDLEDGKSDWDNWFVPFFAFLKKHPEIKLFYYIEENWTTNPSYVNNNWGDARMGNNAYIVQQWNQELSKPQYLHVGMDYLLNDPA